VGLRRLLESPESKRQERLTPYLDAAQSVAFSRASDDDAKEQLQTLVNSSGDLIHEAVKELASTRGSYADDRAYRLLAAVAIGHPVEQPDPANLVQFTEEMHLGRRPLNEAFAFLAKREPRLADLRAEVETDPPRWRRRHGRRISNAALELVGSGTPNNTILRTELATSIVIQTLMSASGAPDWGDLSTAYFDAPFKTTARISSLGKLTATGFRHPPSADR
jgi:hypothetical protein